MIYQQLKIAAILLIFFVIANQLSLSQNYKIDIFISEQPNEEVIVGRIKGDKFTPVDTVMPKAGNISFELSNSAATGVYRLLLGQTVYAQVMHEAPQKLDFIFNKENCFLKSNFNSPSDSLLVIESEENMVWAHFSDLDKTYKKQLIGLVTQINYFQEKSDDKYYTEKRRKETIKKYNEIQQKRNALVSSSVKKHPNLFATKMIKMYTEPFMDGNLSEKVRNRIFERDFFKGLDFSDEQLLNSAVYTKKVYSYLTSYTKKELSHEDKVKEMNRAADRIIEHTNSNKVVGAYIVDFLMRGFEMLQFDEVLQHIAEVYTPSVPCKDGDKSTLNRRLNYQKMLPGTLAPQFSLIDVIGDSVSLSDISSNYKLIIFWASWCPHCKQLLPNIYQWYLNRDVDIEVIAISIDENQDDWRSFVTERDYNWINCSEPEKWDGKVATEYNIYATPTMFLLDKENQIISKPLTFNDFLDRIMSLPE